MKNLQLTQVPVTKTGMLMRRPVEEVFEAFVNPDITSKFWFTKSSGRLEDGKQVQGEWEMYGISIPVKQVTDSTQGFTLVLAGLKAFNEHNIQLNLVVDRYPKGIEDH